ncbi:MAG: lysophospholipid acyltransferase family protein [Clostridia bacterium]|nr:lysophospholipid acyltransferase family protein [Clostridia bacterium]
MLKFLLGWILKRIYAFKTDRPKSIKGPFLVLANHVTAVDPVLLNLSFRDQMYIVASEHLMQKGLPSKLLKLLFDPIVRRKGDSAVTAVKEMLACLKAGFNVCVFPEGTCSYDGTNSPMLPTIGKLAKTSGCTLVTYRFEGGYFTLPRWGRGIRRGSYCGHIVNVYAPETLSAMSASEVNAAIEADLYGKRVRAHRDVRRFVPEPLPRRIPRKRILPLPGVQTRRHDRNEGRCDPLFLRAFGRAGRTVPALGASVRDADRVGRVSERMA